MAQDAVGSSLPIALWSLLCGIGSQSAGLSRQQTTCLPNASRNVQLCAEIAIDDSKCEKEDNSRVIKWSQGQIVGCVACQAASYDPPGSTRQADGKLFAMIQTPGRCESWGSAFSQARGREIRGDHDGRTAAD